MASSRDGLSRERRVGYPVAVMTTGRFSMRAGWDVSSGPLILTLSLSGGGGIDTTERAFPWR